MVGILDTSMSERLQLEPKLTLDKARKLVCQRDAVKEQGEVLKGSKDALLQGVQSGGRRKLFANTWKQQTMRERTTPISALSSQECNLLQVQSNWPLWS